MFIRIQISVRRKEHLSKDAPKAIVYEERTYEDDLVGEMAAAEDAARCVNRAIDELAAQESAQE